MQKEYPIRESVRDWLRCAAQVPARELEYMKDHPEDMDWLQRKVRPRFWANFAKQMVAHFPEDDSLQKRLGTEACIKKGDHKTEAEKEQEGGDWSDRIDQDPENTRQGKYYSEFV